MYHFFRACVLSLFFSGFILTVHGHEVKGIDDLPNTVFPAGLADGSWQLNGDESLIIVRGLRDVIGQRLVAVCADLTPNKQLDIIVGDGVSALTLRHDKKEDGRITCGSIVFPLNSDVILQAYDNEGEIVGTYSVK